MMINYNYVAPIFAYLVMMFFCAMLTYLAAVSGDTDCNFNRKINYILPAGVIGCWLAEDMEKK